MRIRFAGLSALVAATLVATVASAAQVVVTPGNPQGWSNPAGENGNGTGHSEISATAPRSGNGSVELSGDRTRWVVGSLYSSQSNLGLFSDFTNLAFDYRIDPTSISSCCDNKYSPALGIVVWDGGVKDTFIFEQAYQAGGYGAAGALGSWNSTSGFSTFYKKSLANENNQATLATWGAGLSSSAYISAVYVGVGSGIGASYHAYADNIVAGANTYNFEVRGVVPEPTTWAMMIFGLGGVGAMLRRRQRVTAIV